MINSVVQGAASLIDVDDLEDPPKRLENNKSSSDGGNLVITEMSIGDEGLNIMNVPALQVLTKTKQ